MVATRFAVAAHVLLLLAGQGRECSERPALPGTHRDRPPATSARLAQVVNTNPVVVRRITGQLARAGLIRVFRGPGGAELARPADKITLDDVWRAVNAGAARPLVPLHARNADADAGARVMHDALASAFGEAEAAFRQALGRTTLEGLVGTSRSMAA
jgi:DNA-binding IscR family transcriptional regulator